MFHYREVNILNLQTG